ncbi:GNAT family N-acetyltransferase [Thioclava litoralis]|uniref:GNAT family N-acetyltransferase n=1 Tax=Thioclava litoralis TaxID=3076557 RepID=A0ABZ1E0Y1_9RHOB|nr:GNAT family N-acetyltransferase [Thioclava sp. FTW29]
MSRHYLLPAEFETARYHLRRVEVNDAKVIFDSYATDADVTRFLGWKPHRNIADTSAFLERAAAEWIRGNGFPIVAFDRKNGDFIGMFHPKLIGHRVNYGYVLQKAAWGKGCATEVMRWLLEHALAHPEIHRAEAFCDVEHPASARVMEKAGMEREGILRRYFRHPNISEAPRDCVIYSKVR